MHAVFGLFVSIFLFCVMKSCVVDPALMSQNDVPDFVEIVRISPIHSSLQHRHGSVISVTLHNKSATLLTPAFLYADDAPIWMGCQAFKAGKKRPVVMKMDWILGAKTNDVAFPQISPKETKIVDFSIKLDSDFEPIDSSYTLSDCFIGGNKSQAMYQVGINRHDVYRGKRYTNN